MPTLTPASHGPAHPDLVEDLVRSPAVRILLDRLPRLGLPDWWLAGPALAQTVWNVLDDIALGRRITSFEVVYHEPRDLTYTHEDHVQALVDALSPGLGAVVVARNAARAHLRLEEELGIRTRPFEGSRHLVSSYAVTTSCLGVAHDGRGNLRVHAPHGVADVYARRLRPNPLVGTAASGVELSA